MKYYLTIRLMPNAEVGPAFIRQKVFQKLHIVLVNLEKQNGRQPVGVSFPQYGADKKNRLGNLIRLHAAHADELAMLDMDSLMAAFSGYAQAQPIKELTLPPTEYGCFYRGLPSKKTLTHQPARCAERNRRRREKWLAAGERGKLERDDARRQRIEAGLTEEKTPNESNRSAGAPQDNLPYIILNSLSSGNTFSLFIRKETVKGLPSVAEPTFNAYGLSKNGCVPVF